MVLKIVVLALSATVCLAKIVDTLMNVKKILNDSTTVFGKERNEAAKNSWSLLLGRSGKLPGIFVFIRIPTIEIRPCELSNTKCIRDNLSSNSRCNVRGRGSAPAVLTVPQARFETPFFNASYVDNNLVIKGLDRCFVSEFYFNTETDGGVLALDCPWLTFASDRTMLQHYSLKEDQIFHYTIEGTYPLIRLTTSLAKSNRLNLCEEFTFADVAALPIFKIDPKDRATQNFLNRDLSMLNIYEREMFLYRAKLLARTYINSVICDFGCNS